MARKDFWQRYKIKYNWDFEITGNVKPLNMYLMAFNGEVEYFDFADNPFGKRRPRSMPKKIDLTWRVSSKPSSYGTVVFFDGDETEQAFKKLVFLELDEDIGLQIETDGFVRQSKVYLVTPKYSLELKKCKIEQEKYAP